MITGCRWSASGPAVVVRTERPGLRRTTRQRGGVSERRTYGRLDGAARIAESGPSIRARCTSTTSGKSETAAPCWTRTIARPCVSSAITGGTRIEGRSLLPLGSLAGARGSSDGGMNRGPDPSRVFAELTEEERDVVAGWCNVLGLEVADWASISPLRSILESVAVQRRAAAEGGSAGDAIRTAATRLGLLDDGLRATAPADRFIRRLYRWHRSASRSRGQNVRPLDEDAV